MTGFRHHVFVCLNERPAEDPRGCCSARGGEVVFRALKAAVAQVGLADVRVNRAGCMDHCAHGPSVVVYPEGTWYRVATADEARDIVRMHLVEGRPVEPLLMDAPTPSPATGTAA